MNGRAPMAWAAAALAAGISVRWIFGPPAWSLGALFAALVGAGVCARRRFFRHPSPGKPWTPGAGLLLIGVALWGIGRAELDLTAPADGIVRWIGAEPRPVHLEATLIGGAEPDRSGRTIRAWVRAERIRTGEEWRRVSGRLQLRAPAQVGALTAGDRLQLNGLLRAGREGNPVRRAEPPSGTTYRWNERRWLWIQGAEGVLSVADVEGVTRLGARAGPWIAYQRWVGRFRANLLAAGRAQMEPEEAGCLEALLLGERRGIPQEIWEAFRKTGTVHVLVVSGLHVGLIGALALTVMTLLRFARSLRTAGLAGTLLTYCFLTGADPPIVRATVMGLLFCLARWKGEEDFFVNGLGVAAAGMMAVHPRVLADPGAQLSFAAVAGILAADSFMLRLSSVEGQKTVRAHFITRHFEAEGREIPSLKTRSLATLWLEMTVLKRALKWITRPLAVSCGAWLATAPILAWHFRTLSLAAPLLNLLVIPWSSLLIACGFLVYLAGGVHPAAAAPFSAAFGFLAGALNQAVLRVAALPGITLNW